MLSSIPHKPSSLPRAILFDNDGVLIASEPLHWSAWEALLQKLGIPYHQEDMLAQVGKTAPEILRVLLDKYRPGWNPADYDLNTLALEKNDIYLLSLSSRLQAYPGVPEGLHWLKENGVKAAVVSNAKRREVHASLTALGLAPYFDLMLSRDDVPAPKPDPMAYLTAAAVLGVEPSECIGVEDSPTGLESLLLAKIPAAAILTNFPPAELTNPIPGRPDLKPTWLFPTIQDFFTHLKSL